MTKKKEDTSASDAFDTPTPAVKEALAENVPFAEKEEFVPEPKATVQVTQEELAGMMARLSSLEADNKRLLDAVDRSRLQKADAKLGANIPLVPEMGLTQMEKDGPIVLSWKMTKNDSFTDGNKLVERQYIELFYEDGTQEEMPLIQFYRNKRKDMIGEVVSRSKDEATGEESVTLRLPDGRKLTVGLAYVN